MLENHKERKDKLRSKERRQRHEQQHVFTPNGKKGGIRRSQVYCSLEEHNVAEFKRKIRGVVQ